MRPLLSFVILSLFLSFSATTSSAQSAEAKAKTILKKTSALYQKATGIEVTMTLDQEFKKMGVNEKVEVELKSKGDKFVSSFGSNVIYCNGATVWAQNTEEKEITITKYSPDMMMGMNPSQLFSAYKKGYKYQWIEDEKVNTKNCSLIELVPEAANKKKGIFKIKLWVNKSNNQIEKSQTLADNGDVMTFTIKSQNLKKKFVDTDFVPTAKVLKDNVVTDMR